MMVYSCRDEGAAARESRAPMTEEERMRATTLVSVVIPTHNRGAFLRKALASVFRQTHNALDIIVVDDASSDGTPAIVREVRDPRLRYLRHNNRRGGSAARNTGIQAARGEYLAFLDDDDEWLDDKITRQLEAISDYAAVVCAALVDGRRATRRYRREQIDVGALRRGYLGGGTSSLFVRTQVLRDFPFDESLPLGQDWDLLVRLAARHPIRYLPEAYVLFNDGSHERITTAAASLSTEAVEARMRVYQKHRSFLGPFWFRFHVASMLLYRLRERHDGWARFLYTWRRCGAAPVLAYYGRQTWWRVAGRWGEGMR